MDTAPPNLIQTPLAIHQQAADDISANLKQVLEGEDHQVIPVTADSQVEIGDNLNQKIERVIFNKPGHEPSKSFLEKLKERVGKKPSYLATST